MVALASDIDLRDEILRLKEERNAIILAHNYQIGEIQDIADYVGDSLGLAFKARDTEADVIAFCGVHFMAETAKIINPDKTVVLPDKDAGCSLEEACPAPALEAFLEKHADKNYYVVAYINCSAGVKALSDVICTSGNAIQHCPKCRVPEDRNILFVPDENLGSLGHGTDRAHKWTCGKEACYVHVEFTRDSIRAIREEHPDAELIAHPECTYAVRMLADEICSTEKMVHYARDSKADTLIVATEAGMLHRLKKEVPDKNFLAGPTDNCNCAECRFMKMNTMEKLRDCLANLAPQIEIPEETRRRAEEPITRMLEWSK